MDLTFADPLRDSGFKIIFSKKRNMIALLEAILNFKIKDIDYLDVEWPGLTTDEPKNYFDLSVKLNNGGRCVVEMQKANLKYND